MICESVRPVQGPKIGKRGFRSRKTPISPHPRKQRFESKNPHFYTGHHKENGDFLTRSAHFWGWGGMEIFRLRNPLFPILGFLAPVQGGRIRKSCAFVGVSRFWGFLGGRCDCKFWAIPQARVWKCPKLQNRLEFLGGRFGCFYVFSAWGGEGGVRGAGVRRGAGRFFIENPRRGVVSRPRGREGVCGELGNFLRGGGGGVNFFFFGAEMSTKICMSLHS